MLIISAKLSGSIWGICCGKDIVRIVDEWESKDMKIEGSCHCGKISYEAEINPEYVVICHCTDSQTISGGRCPLGC
jgi:hypothetical protein